MHLFRTGRSDEVSIGGVHDAEITQGFDIDLGRSIEARMVSRDSMATSWGHRGDTDHRFPEIIIRPAVVLAPGKGAIHHGVVFVGEPQGESIYKRGVRLRIHHPVVLRSCEEL